MGSGLVADPSTGAFFVFDSNNNRIRNVTVVTRQAATLVGSTAGSFDSAFATALLKTPTSGALSVDGQVLYVCDTGNNAVRALDLGTRTVSTLVGSILGTADGVGIDAHFNGPWAAAVSPDGASLYVADYGNARIRRVDIASRLTSTLAGSVGGFLEGVATNARFNGPAGIAVSPDGAMLFVADYANHRIRSVNVSSRLVATLCGSSSGSLDGFGTSSLMWNPVGLALDPSGRYLFVADRGNNRVRVIVVATRQLVSLAGSGLTGGADGVGTAASFNAPSALALDATGAQLIVVESGGQRMRVVTTLLLRSICQAGHYCSAGASTATGNGVCAAGSVCPAGSSSPTQIACGSGFYCAAGSSLMFDTPCTAGFFCAAGADRAPCASGTFCAAGSVSNTVLCALGSVCVTPASQVACSLGNFCSSGSTAQQPCAVGSFCATPSSQVCFLSSAGSFASRQLAISLSRIVNVS